MDQQRYYLTCDRSAKWLCPVKQRMRANSGEECFLNLFSNCEWAWSGPTQQRQAGFFTGWRLPFPMAVLPSLSMFEMSKKSQSKGTHTPNNTATHSQCGMWLWWLLCDQRTKKVQNRRCLCGPGLVSSAGDAGCSESGLKDPDCWLILRSHKGCCLLVIAGRWP